MNLKKCDRCKVVVEAKQADRWKRVGYVTAADDCAHAMIAIAEVCESCFNAISDFCKPPAQTLSPIVEAQQGNE